MKIPSIFSLFNARSRDAGRLAIGFGARGIHLAQVELGGGKPRVVRCEYRDTGEGAASALQRVAREAGDGACSMLLAAGEYQMLLVNAPGVPDAELKAAVRWKIKDGLGYPVEEAGVDVLKIPSDRQDRAQSLYAISVANDTIQKRIALFEQAGLPLCVIEIPETAQRNVAALFERDDSALALLAFDDKGGLLTFSRCGELYLSRRIEISAAQLCDANTALRAQYLDRVELELQRSLDYFDRQFGHLSLSHVVLSAPERSGLLDFLRANLGIPVEGLDLSTVMDIAAAPELSDSEFVCAALPTLGAALRQEALGQQINLYNPAFCKPRTPIPASLIATCLMLIAAAALLFYGYTLYRTGDAERSFARNAALLDAGQATLAGFSPDQAREALRGELQQLEKQAADANRVADELRRAGADNTDGYSEALRALTRQLLPGLSLNGFRMDGETISVAGSAASPDLVQKYIKKLGGESALQHKNVSMLKIEPRRSDAGHSVEFSLSLTQDAGDGR